MRADVGVAGGELMPSLRDFPLDERDVVSVMAKRHLVNSRLPGL